MNNYLPPYLLFEVQFTTIYLLQQALIDTLGSQLLEQLENLEDSSSCPSPARRKGDQQAEMGSVIVNP
jgi:hypothetical protein